MYISGIFRIYHTRISYLDFCPKKVGAVGALQPLYKILCVHLRKFNITYLSYKDNLVGLEKNVGAVGALKKGGRRRRHGTVAKPSLT